MAITYRQHTLRVRTYQERNDGGGVAMTHISLLANRDQLSVLFLFRFTWKQVWNDETKIVLFPFYFTHMRHRRQLIKAAGVHVGIVAVHTCTLTTPKMMAATCRVNTINALPIKYHIHEAGRSWWSPQVQHGKQCCTTVLLHSWLVWALWSTQNRVTYLHTALQNHDHSVL